MIYAKEITLSTRGTVWSGLWFQRLTEQSDVKLRLLDYD